MKKVFVYGTLMSGQSAAGKLSGCPCLGVFRLADYAMYDLGAYPGIKMCQGENVIGELYEVDDEAINRLDMYECEGSLYTRTEVMVSREEEELDTLVYVYNGDVGERKPVREAWNSKSTDYVWYAGYGSNLSEERFKCYIQGGVNPYNPRKSNRGCTDKSLWIEEKMKDYPGCLYFGNQSSTWSDMGVAFFDPKNAQGESHYRSNVHMHLYKITREQLHDVQNQEGNLDSWYGKMYCLDVLKDNCPVYTLTSETPVDVNEPSEQYAELIRSTLVRLLGEEREFEIENYMAEAGLHDWVGKRLQARAEAYNYNQLSTSHETVDQLKQKIIERDIEIKKLREENESLQNMIRQAKSILNDR